MKPRPIPPQRDRLGNTPASRYDDLLDLARRVAKDEVATSPECRQLAQATVTAHAQLLVQLDPTPDYQARAAKHVRPAPPHWTDAEKDDGKAAAP